MTTLEQYPLNRSKILKKTIATIWAHCFWFIFIAIIFEFDIRETHLTIGLGSLAVFFGIFLLIDFIISYIYQIWYFNTYFYDLTDTFVTIRKGPLAPREITIPYQRIQDVYVDQDILDRIFGIYDVHLSSATLSSGIEAHIDGVDKAGADGISALLLARLREHNQASKI